MSKLLLMSLMMRGKDGALAKFYQGLLGVVDGIHGMQGLSLLTIEVSWVLTHPHEVAEHERCPCS